jgi:uncharacterized protein YtpQ (UPF0354 family)
VHDPLTPIDPDAPVSGHAPAPPAPIEASRTPEHEWEAAASRIFPLLRPAGTPGAHVTEIDTAALAASAAISHAQPLVDDGPAGLCVVYAMAADGFDVIVNGDHLLGWGVGPAAIQDAAIANLAAWSAAAPWSSEASERRRVVSSTTGDGWDAARILLPEVADHLRRELAGTGRLLVGLPERHLLIAALMQPDDIEFAVLLAEFVLEQSGGADEPIDRGLFELVDGGLIPFAP